jgi:hypothetical protein
MKNTFKLFGIIALLAVIGFSMAACDNGTTDAGGTFTMTDIPAEYNGKYAVFLVKVENVMIIWGIQGRNTDGSKVLTKINNGKAVMPLLREGTWEPYKGNDTFVSVDFSTSVRVIIIETDTGTVSSDLLPVSIRLDNANLSSVKFSNGSASESWNNRTNK